MTQNNVGIYASQISGHLWAPNGAFDALATTTVGSTSVASITFHGIPQGYKHLQIRGIGRTDFAQTDANFDIQFNGDTGSNYSGHYLFSNGTGSPVTSGGGGNTQINMYRGTGATSASGVLGAGICNILDYSSSTKNKTVRTLTGHDQNMAYTGYIFMFSGAWNNTSPITSIKIIPSNGNIGQYSQFALYGVK